MKWYIRYGKNVLFLLPTIAVGIDVDGRCFIEAGWLLWVVGLGDAP